MFYNVYDIISKSFENTSCFVGFNNGGKIMSEWIHLSEGELLNLVPRVTGLYFVSCPNCTGGLQENQLKNWSPKDPESVSCQYCGMKYPNEKYPDNKVQVVLTPGGNTITYSYYENSDGYRYYFSAAREYNKRVFCENLILELAQKWQETGTADYAKKAIKMMYRFAQVWPDYCWHFDYPFRQKIWEQGYVPPEKCREGYRTARWNWWGFTDLSDRLITAYGILIQGSFWETVDKEINDNAKAKIEWFFRDNADHLIAQKTQLGNMHPYLWSAVAKLGTILKDLKYIHYPFPGMHEILAKGFFSDGVWCEGSPDYMAQTVHGILKVCKAVGDWKDPVEYIPGEDDVFLDGQPVEEKFPVMVRAMKALDLLRFPYGERLTLHDSWGFESYPYPVVSDDYKEDSFLLPALGHVCLTAGKGKTVGRADLTWSGGYGHQHMDGLSLMVSAHGREPLSDIGYTHTKYRGWTLSTAAHNTVVVDCENQAGGSLNEPTDGNLSFLNCSNPVFQIVSVDNPEVYPKCAKTYNRTLARIQMLQDDFYIIDRFCVKGGSQHDYFLHGDCLAQQQIYVTENRRQVDFTPVESLLPDGVVFIPPKGENDVMDCRKTGYAYGFLCNIRLAEELKTGWTNIDYQYTGKAVGSKNDTQKINNYESELGLKVHINTIESDRLYVGENPSVRQGRNDDQLLDLYRRKFAMLRRTPEYDGSTFLSVIEPYVRNSKIKKTSVLKKENNCIILSVEWDDYMDLIFYNAGKEESIEIANDTLIVKGQYGFIRFEGGNILSVQVVCGSICYGDFCIKSGESQSFELIDVSNNDFEGIVIVSDPNKDLNPQPGEIVLIKRDLRIRGLKVKKVTRKNDCTQILVSDHIGFTYDVAEKTSYDTCFPKQSYKGPHEIIWKPVAVKNTLQ